MRENKQSAHLLLVGEERCTIMIESKPYILVHPPKWIIDEEETRVYTHLTTGSAVIYVDNGKEMIIFDADVDEVYDSLIEDDFETEEVKKLNLEKIDIAWFT